MAQLGSSPISNLWLGSSRFDFASVNEKGEVSIVTANTYLDKIEYVVDIHVPKSEIASLITGNVGVAYTTSGTDDFADEDTDARGNVKIYQEVGDYTLTFGAEALGRYPATLKKNFVSHLNSGADSITLSGNSAKLLAGTAVANSIEVPFSNVGPAVAGIQCSAIPKAISAQMQGFASDENLLRLVAAADSYNNLMTFPLSGAKDSAGNTRAMHTEVRGAQGASSSMMGTVRDILNDADLSDATLDVSTVYPGHLMVAAIFNAHPPRAGTGTAADNYSANVSTAGSNLWVRRDLGGTVSDVGDFLVLNDTSAITEELVLQYVLKTKMTLIARDGSTELNKTLKSPDDDVAAANEVHILYNIRFDN